MTNEIDLNRLMSLIPHGHLKAATNPQEFVDEVCDTIDRLRKFHDAVMDAMVENADNMTDQFAYIWQRRWDQIKAEAASDAMVKDA